MWNYRIIRKKEEKSDEYYYQIHEVYYSKRKKITDWTLNPIKPLGSTKEELISSLLTMLSDVYSKPILEEINGKLKEI